MTKEKRLLYVLLVEDNPADVELTRNAFKEANLGHRLDVAESGDEALSRLRREGAFADVEAPDLVLLDLNLPGTDGMEVLKAMKDEASLKWIPVVVLTSSASPQDVVSCYEHFASAYVVKPMIFDRFVEVVKQIEGFWFGVATLASDVRRGQTRSPWPFPGSVATDGRLLSP